MADKSHGRVCVRYPSLFVRIIYSDRMRSVFDKEKVFEIFKEIFHEFPEITKANSLVYDIISTRDLIQIGQATLERNSDHYTEGNLGNLTILPYQLPYMESVMFLCVKNFWLPILVGAVGSGKSSIVRLLAKLTGNTLHEFSVNSAMDSYELVGGFHQVGWERKVKICLDRLQNELASLGLRIISILTILLEGIPGVGKSSIVMALARCYGYELVRINLSEQTDISDLFGADLPSDSGNAGEFMWRDGPLLRALKEGVWVLLDELNLASQSVLEGLNSCFDHRQEIYISELDRTFEIKTQSTRIFATQNPMRQGGGRKGLPKSFLNRFTKVFMQPLETIDLLFICRQAFSEIDEETLRLMVAFNQSIDASVNQDRAFGGLGFPFEFNLRDIFRWCQLMADKSHGSLCQPSLFVRIIYSDRMRSVFDKEKVFEIFKEIFHEFPEITKANSLVYDIISTRDLIQIGQATLERNSDHYTEGNLGNLTILPYQLPYMESVMLCVKNFWLPILVGAVGSGKSSIVRLFF